VSEVIRAGKFVELTYQVTDRKSGHVLTRVEFPLGYVHGHNEILAPSVHMQLEGKSAGDVIEVAIDGNQIFGPRDESLSSPTTSRTSPRNTGRSAPPSSWRTTGARPAAFS
jgi:FKBP-type peptidyl-prolyl cis-trans isomerase SlyD